jgi:uncharacterized membrane protein
MKSYFFSCLAVLCFLPAIVTGAEVVADQVFVEKAVVLDVISEHNQKIPGTEVFGVIQNLSIKIIDGVEKGKIFTIENDYNQYKVGDEFYLNYMIRADDGYESHVITDFDRVPVMLFFSILFVVLVVIVGGKPGLRGIVSLLGSLVLILFALIPSIMSGVSPVLASIVVSSFIIILGSYVTHGFNKTTTSAVIGMICTVVVTGALAYIAVDYSRLTGFESDEAVFLNLNSRGHIDILGILLGGIMIGLLGVLYDVAIGQAIFVEELHAIAPQVSKMKIFSRAMRMGREHIGALVNTLAIAYVGASLPLLLLFSNSGHSVLHLLNREVFATEIIRTLIGSIGLVLAVPITTVFSIAIIFGKRVGTNPALDSDMEIPETKMHHHH